jgi:hypothetical protein
MVCQHIDPRLKTEYAERRIHLNEKFNLQRCHLATSPSPVTATWYRLCGLRRFLSFECVRIARCLVVCAQVATKP